MKSYFNRILCPCHFTFALRLLCNPETRTQEGRHFKSCGYCGWVRSLMKMEQGMQLIDGNGKFNVDGLKDFMTATEFAQSGLSYAIVAIIGSQSSGKQVFNFLTSCWFINHFLIIVIDFNEVGSDSFSLN